MSALHACLPSARALAAIAAVVLQGCASPPTYRSDVQRQPIAALAIRAGDLKPEVRLPQFPGKSETAIKGGLVGAGIGVGLGLAALLSCGIFAPSCAAATAAFYGSAAAGAAIGYSLGEPQPTIATAESTLRKTMEDAGPQLHAVLRDEALAYAKVAGVRGLVEDGDSASMLELGVVQIEVKQTRSVYSIELLARARLIEAGRGVLWEQSFFHTSETQRLSFWAADDGAAFRRAITQGLRTLAEFTVDEALLLRTAPEPARAAEQRGPKEWQPPVPMVPVSPRDLAPAQPVPVRAVEVENPLPPSTVAFFGGDLTLTGAGFAEVDSLRPTLRWKRYFVSEIAAPTYEVRVFEAQNSDRPGIMDNPAWVPGDIVYHRNAIADHEATLETDLEPCRRYFWTVRARWEAETMLAASEWSGRYIRTPATLRRAPDPLFGLGTLHKPAVYYFPFITACR
jgi:hypothetical protein